MSRLLRPRSIAIVGASSSPGSLGAAVLGNLERLGFAGEIHLINPKRREIDGRACLASARDLPPGVDCAVLAVPRAAVLDAMRDCAAREVGGVIIYAAGFAEDGAEGLAAQREITRIAAAAGMVVEGPNCLGMVNYVDGAPLTFVATPARRLHGRGAAILSQSGAIAAILSVSLHHRNVPLSFTISTGNEAVSGVEDYLDYMIDDAHTEVITLIAEHFREPRRLLSLARRAAARGKPVVLLHPGKSGEARASAATHTGAMAGDYDVMRVMAETAGLIIVDSLAECLDVTELLMRCPQKFGAGLMLLTESGAFKALALDQCGDAALALPALGEAAAGRLRGVLPDFIPATNPLDLTAQALVDPSIYGRALESVLDDADFGVVMFAIILTDTVTSGRKLPAIIDAVTALRPNKPVIVAGLDEGATVAPELIGALQALGVPFFHSAERVFRALAKLSPARHPRHCLPQSCGGGIAPLAAGVIPEYRAKLVLRELGILIPPGRIAVDIASALSIAGEIGYPVALKAQSPDLSHKSDVGGVVLQLGDAAALRQGWARLQENLQLHCPGVAVEGVLVERMGTRGAELIIGARRDPDWGPVLLAGFGGVMAEALRDVRLLPPGLDQGGIIAELHRLKGAAILHGFRGAPALDVAAVADMIMKLDGFLQSHQEILEIDINPVVVYPAGQGAVALDALMLAR